MEMFISIVTSGRHNPTLSVNLDSDTAYIFAIEFINLFGDLTKTDDGIIASGRTYQQKTTKMLEVLRVFIQKHGNRQELWQLYNVLSEMKDGEYFAIATRHLSDDEYDALKEEVMRLNMPDYNMLQTFKDEVFGDCLNNYRLIHYGQEKRQNNIGEPDKSKRKCRYCGESMPNVTFKKVAHTISEGLGNKTIISNDECDKCNGDFGREIEQDLMTFLSPLRVFFSIKGKSGLTKIKDESIVIYEDENGRMNIQMFQKDCPEAEHWKFEQKRDNLKLTFTHPQMVNLQDVYRAVVKYAISVIEETELPHFKETIEWVMKKKSATDVPKLCIFFDHNPKKEENPSVTVFVRTNADRTLPYCCTEVRVSGVIIFGIIPFCDQDDRTFSSKDDWNRLMDVMKVYKQATVWKTIVPNEDEEIRMTYKFNFLKRNLGDE